MYENMIKLRYSVESRERKYIKGYEFMTSDKNIGKSLRSKDSQKLFHRTKKFAADAFKIPSKRAIKNARSSTTTLRRGSFTEHTWKSNTSIALIRINYLEISNVLY